jgi:hypothetical protein
MAQAVVGALRVNLSADSAQFSSGLKNAEGSLGKFGGVIGKAVGVVAAFGAAAAAAAAVVVAQMRNVANSADEMAKSAQKVGLMTEELSALKYTAGLAGVGFDSLQTSLVRLTRAMSEVAKGADNDAAKAFKALGVEVQNADGSLKSSAQVMQEVSDKFATFKDGAEKTALAVAIFGRAGADMIPLLNQGGEAIRKSNDEAKEFGVTISAGLGSASERLNDNLSRLGSAFQGIWIAIGERLIPIFADWSDKLVEVVKNLRLFETAGKAAQYVIEKIGEAATWVIGRLSGLGSVMEGIGVAASRLVSRDSAGVFPALTAGVDGYARAVENASAKIDMMRQKAQEASAFGSLQGAFGAFAPQKPAAPTLGGGEGGGGKGGRSAAAQSEYDAEKEKIEARLTAIREGMMTEAELKQKKFEEDQNLVDQAYQKELITAQEHKDMMLDLEKKHAEAKKKIQEELETTALKSTASMFGSLYSMMGSFGKKNTTLAKALGIAQALINTYTGATQALASAPFPYNMAAFGAVLAKGMSAVAAITSVNTSGGGNSRGGGGGGGGGGSVAAPAEPQQAGKSMYVTLQGEVFNRDMVRGLMEQIQSFQKDGGGKVIFA